MKRVNVELMSPRRVVSHQYFKKNVAGFKFKFKTFKNSKNSKIQKLLRTVDRVVYAYDVNHSK